MLTVPPSLGGAGGRSERVIVEVKDSGGTFRDISSPSGWATSSFVDSVTIEEDIDDPHRTATVVLKRELDKVSIAPLMSNSPLNRGWNPTTAYAPLLKAGREFRVVAMVGPTDAPLSLFTATTPPGTLASTSSVEIFRGRIDRVQSASGEQVEITGRDMGGVLADTWIEEERVYGLAAVAGVPVPLRIWTPSTAYALNEYVIPTEAKRSISGSPRFYKVTTAGTSGATEPTWPTSSTVASGTVTFTYQGTTSPDTGYGVELIMQQIISAWVSGVTLLTPVSPSWNITQFLQQRQPVLEAVRALAQQLGWDLRYKWDTGSGAFALTFYEPARTKTTPDATFASSDYTEISRLEQDITGIRNVWRGVYPDASNRDPEGNPTRGEVSVSDATSITDYGRLFAEIGEDQLSAINTSAKMTQMLNAALADTKDPKIEAETTLVHGWPFVEVGDLYRFSANGRHFDTAQDLAVTHWSTTFESGTMKTSLSCRGKPSGGYAIWHDMTGRTVPDSIHQVRVFEAAGGATPSTKDVVGGTRISVLATPERLALGAEYEYHVSTATGFTPDSTTLKAVTKSTSLELADLVPGKQYYTKIVPRGRNASKLVRGFPSEEVAFLGGRAKAGHYDAAVSQAHFPWNGSFEHATDDLAVAPLDHWFAQAGSAWGASSDLYYTDPGVGVGRALYLRPTANVCRIRSSVFPVRPDMGYFNLSLVACGSGTSAGGGTKRLKVTVSFWVDSAATSASALLPTQTYYYSSAATWAVRSVSLQQLSPPDANFITITLEKESADANLGIEIGYIYLTEAYFQQPAWVGLSYNGAANWADNGGAQAGGSYILDSFGFVCLRGSVKRTAGNTVNGETIATLPSGFRPTNTVSYRLAYGGAGTFADIDITTAGLVQWWSGVVATPANLLLHSVRFPTF